MTSLRLRTIIMGVLLCILGTMPTLAQSSGRITSFTTEYTNVARTGLASGTARIPVSWDTANRPLTANLVFEQILPDGSTVNVELPRPIQWVASRGNGIAAPILPEDNVDNIRLRVSLVSFFSDTIYDTRELVLNIVGNANDSVRPALVDFVPAYNAPINRSQLNNGTIRLPVSWQAINRQPWMNLVFEQVLADGTVVNIELPRSITWVNSSDRGVIAPIAVDDEIQDLVLRVRLVDFFQDYTYDYKYAYVPIQSGQSNSEITQFGTTRTSITRDAVNANQLIDVNWAVSSRPDNTNLVFEQILPDGTWRNAELPRDVPIVASVGNGVLDPILPNQAVDELLFQVRLIDLANNNTLDSAELTVTLLDPNNSSDGRVVVTGDACYQTPFAPSNGVTNGAEVRIQIYNSGSDAYITDDPINYNRIQVLKAGDLAIVQSDPYCTYVEGYPDSVRRRWTVVSGNVEGWVDEYIPIEGYNAQVIIPSNQADIPHVSIENFEMTPHTLNNSNIIAENDFTFTWDTTDAVDIRITPIVNQTDLVDGTTTITGTDIANLDWRQGFSLIARDSQNNYVSQTLNLSVLDYQVAINEFSATLERNYSGADITFNWEIEGGFLSARIVQAFGVHSETTVEDAIGSITQNVLDGSWDNTNRDFVLEVTDLAGIVISETITIDMPCTWEWQISNEHSEQCPLAPSTGDGAYQTFERGFMIWSAASQSIHVFYNDGRTESFNDGWNGTSYDDVDTPPDGLINPERGFGYLWHQTERIRTGLGWATNPEQSYTLTTQEYFSGAMPAEIISYTNLPDNRVVRRTLINDNNTWRYLD
ncbi:MAG: hypothetical protein AAFV93_00580 [Chloroflexota bacterium]